MENKNIIINNANSFKWKQETYYYVGEKRYTVEEFNNAVELLKNPQLNENQQIVLGWLKNGYKGDADPFGTLACLFSQTPKSEVIIASLELTRAEQAQVIQAFSQWALEQEEE